MNKKGCFLFLMVAILLLFTMQNAFAIDKKVYTWNYNTSYDSNYYVGGSFIQHWANRVWRETDKQLKINIFYSGTLGYQGSEMISNLQNGLLESAEFSASLMSAEANQPWWNYEDFYGEYENWDQYMHVFNTAAPLVWEDFENIEGVKLLALFPAVPEAEFEGIWMNKKIEKWDDFKGTKVRAYNRIARKYLLDPLGFSSLFLPGPETYQGLKTGLVDGIIQNPTSGITSSYYEIAKYFYAFSAINSTWWGIMCSQQAFDALPEDVQKGLVKASLELQDLLTYHVWLYEDDFIPGLAGDTSAKESLEFFKQNGIGVYRVPLLEEKAQEQILIGMEQWITDEGGPRAQLLFDKYLEAKKLFPGNYPDLYSALPILDIK